MRVVGVGVEQELEGCAGTGLEVLIDSERRRVRDSRVRDQVRRDQPGVTHVEREAMPRLEVERAGFAAAGHVRSVGEHERVAPRRRSWLQREPGVPRIETAKHPRA